MLLLYYYLFGRPCFSDVDNFLCGATAAEIKSWKQWWE